MAIPFLCSVFPCGSDWPAGWGLQSQVSSEQSFRTELAVAVCCSVLGWQGRPALVCMSRCIGGFGVACAALAFIVYFRQS